MQTKNAAYEMRLNDKYQHIYMYDADTDEIRRIAHCEWSTANRPCQYTVVAQFIATKSGDTEASDEGQLVFYFINDEIYIICIRGAPAVYNYTGDFNINIVERS